MRGTTRGQPPASAMLEVGWSGANPQVQKPETRERHVPAAEHGMTAQTLVLRSTGSHWGSLRVAGHAWAPDSCGGGGSGDGSSGGGVHPVLPSLLLVGPISSHQTCALREGISQRVPGGDGGGACCCRLGHYGPACRAHASLQGEDSGSQFSTPCSYGQVTIGSQGLRQSL